MKRRLGIILSILSFGAICFFTLRPGGTEYTRSWSFYLTSGDAALAELIQNLLLFMPLGIGLTLVSPLSRRERGSGGEDLRWPYAVVGIGGFLSFCVEFAQQYIPGRDPSLGDIVANTISTALGVLLVVAAWFWLFAPPRRAAWQALAMAGIAVLAWIATAELVKQSFPPFPYNVVLTPDWENFGHYQGKVLEVHPSLHARMDIRVLAAPYPPGRTAPLIAVLAAGDERVWVLSVDGEDLSLRYDMPALHLLLEQPDLRFRGALHGVAPRDTFTAATWHDTTDICLAVNSRQRCGLGYTIGDGWKLIFYPEGRPAWQLGVINALWLMGCVIGVGFWHARGRRRTPEGAEGTTEKVLGRVAIVIAILGSIIVPLATDLNATPVYEFLAVIGGILLGNVLGNWNRPHSSFLQKPSADVIPSEARGTRA
jgi:VanZ like family